MHRTVISSVYMVQLNRLHYVAVIVRWTIVEETKVRLLTLIWLCKLCILIQHVTQAGVLHTTLVRWELSCRCDCHRYVGYVGLCLYVRMSAWHSVSRVTQKMWIHFHVICRRGRIYDQMQSISFWRWSTLVILCTHRGWDYQLTARNCIRLSR